MPCADRQLTDAEREAAFEQQRTGVQRGIRPFTGEATPEAIADYLNREVFPVLKQARDKINEVYLPVVDNAPSANPLGFYFSETTTNADPTTGYIQLDNATQNIATTIRVSQQNGRDKDITTWLDVMSGSATSPLGVVTLSHAINPSRFLRFDLTSMTDQGAYWDLAVTAVESSHTNPFVEDDQIAIQFIPGVSSGSTTVPLGSLSVTGPTLLGRNDVGTGAVEELSGAEAGHLIKKAVDITANISANQNDWAPTGFATCDHLFVSTGGGDYTITGFDISVFDEQDGTEFVLTLTSTGSLTFTNNSGSSGAGNRLRTPTSAGSTFRIGQNESILFRYVNGLWQACPYSPLLTGQLMGNRIRKGNTITATLSGTTHNWAPTNLRTADHIEITLTGDATLTGLDSSVFAVDGETSTGREIIIHNVDSTDTLSLPSNSGSLTGNCFHSRGPNRTLNVRPGQSVHVRKDGNFWVARLFEGPLLANSVMVNDTTSTADPRGLVVNTDSMVARISGNIVSHPFSTVAGAGLTYSAGALAVGAGTGITVGADTVGWNGTTTFVADGDKGHIVVSSSGTVWVWDNPISITGSQEIAPTGSLTFTVGADLLANATSGVFVGAAVSASSVATGNIEHAGTADSLWNMQSGMNITLGGTALSGPGTAVGTGVLAVNADTGISLRAGHATANNTGAGDILANATSGIHLFAGATPQTAASGIQLTSDTVVDAQPTTDLRVGAGSGFNLRAGSTTLVSADDGDGVLQATGGIAIRAGTGTLGTVTGAADGTVSITASDDVTINPTDDLVLQTNGTTRARINAAGDWDFENGLDFDVTGSVTIDTSGAGTDLTLTAVDDATFAGNDVFLTGAAQTVVRATAGNTVLAASSDVRIETNSTTRLSVEEDGSWDLAGDAGDLGSSLLSQGSSSPPIWADRTDVVTRTTIIAGGSSAETNIISHAVTANTWVVGTTYEFFAHCEYVRSGAPATSHTVTVDCELNGTAIGVSLATLSGAQNSNTSSVIVRGYLTCSATGGSGTGRAAVKIEQNILAATNALDGFAGTSNPTLDTTASNTLSITVDLSAGVSGVSFVCQRAWIRRVV